MQVWVILVFYNSLCSQWIASGRIAWALARDGGLPFSQYFAHVDEGLGFPLRTTILAIIFCAVYGLVYLGSTNAFNSIVTSAVLYLNISYAIPQVVLLFRGRSILPERPFRLGRRLGIFCNLFSPFAVIVLAVLSCFPVSLPTTVESMNYSSVVLVGLLLIITGIWLTIGKNFRGPNADLQVTNML
ncbi:amino acid/polyamine transporter I [Hypoxylon trugodes]|uniref:amino acid/polyamine transporter I n=1 Tax=Hypoxylon trugodes TaxID=326681 RepID=UPI002199CB73|nr:amino acid/polyamine transporter I [Hypoxylon trugodes]KAI1390614.1 amino acid/polyamine transporter I [Hypoxylon trugodes]